MSGRNDVTRSGTCGTTCILDDVHYSIRSLRTQPARAWMALGTTPPLRYSALYRGTPIYTYTGADHHALFMTGSPKIHRQRGTTRTGGGTYEMVECVASFMVSESGMYATLDCRIVTTHSKQIILANENASLPAVANVIVTIMRTRRQKAPCCHLP